MDIRVVTINSGYFFFGDVIGGKGAEREGGAGGEKWGFKLVDVVYKFIYGYNRLLN
jgi:hypothetical protein